TTFIYQKIQVLRIKGNKFKKLCKYVSISEDDKETLILIKEVLRYMKNNNIEKVFYIPNIKKFPVKKDIKEFFINKNINSAVFLPVQFNEDFYLISIFFESTDYLETKDELDIIVEIRDDIRFALEHINQQKKLFLQKYFDEITGVGNRNFFIQYLKNLKDRKTSFVIFLIDIYHFKYINEEYGREFGDKVLRFLAKTLDSVLINEDVFRVGFDEFAIVCTRNEPIKIVDGIKNVLSNVKIDEHKLKLDFNIAVIRYPEDESDIERLILKLERLLDISKSKGKNVIQYYSEEQYSTIKDLISIENKLEEAIRNNDFDIYLQPIVKISSNKIVGAEALIRWKDENGNFIPPSKFIPVAEQTGLIKEIDICMLLKAKETIEYIDNSLKKKVRISVNITPAYVNNIIEFFEKGYIPKCKIKTDFDFSKVKELITLELTERETVEVYESKELLQKIKNIGFKISIDDFGTGYSSLSYLINLDVDYLKIDMQFIRKITEDEKVYKLVKSIINIAKIFGIKTIAEGVETKQQLEILKKLGCNFYQGYLFSPPVSVDEFIRMLK
ncbi:bifunctional diguanylate cyclase/phosphodiesterase, partial [Hydrogenivirga sp. 128-5-R1-1]|uniref:putative bifunctional diguanylate cyclase/phosphodiesterase n=1 Tax=Hydrogenivirga sp. 128-5-R1-1 TaxID=392423 RepID=UPI00015F2FF9